MNRAEATALIQTTDAPKGALAVGSTLSYEDMANPRRVATVIGYRTTRWGTDAIVHFEVFEGEEGEGRFDTLSLAQLVSAAPVGSMLAGWRIESEVVALGNGERMSRGVYETVEGAFLAMTFTQSKTFKTRAGAERWLARKLGA